MKFSYSWVTAREMRDSGIIAHLRRQLADSLGGNPDSYEWRFVPKGEILYEEVVAPRDMVEIVALR